MKASSEQKIPMKTFAMMLLLASVIFFPVTALRCQTAANRDMIDGYMDLLSSDLPTKKAEMIRKEEKHWPIDSPDPIEAILFAMEQRGLSRRDLEPFIGSRARVAEVLNHKRSLTLPMIRRLHEGLGIPAEVLIGESVAA
jgi:antitoxin component HigA of HigAB toxin-antitoxin module